MQDDKEELLTTDDVASRYKIDKLTQKRFREKQGLPFLKPGKRIFYKKEVLYLWLKQYSVNEAYDEKETR